MDALLWVLSEDGTPRPARDEREFAENFMRRDLREVARDELPGGVVVSTVFTGMNMAVFEGSAPVLWETLVRGGDSSGWARKYTTRAEAEAGHAAVVARERLGLL